jgi:hypothetical protein
VSFGIEDKLARVVKRHKRLQAILPAEVAELVRALVTVKATAEAVAALEVETVDFATELDAGLRAGVQPDAAELVQRYATTQRASDEVRAVRAQVNALPPRYAADIVRVINDAALTFPDELADQLDQLLDDAAPLAAQLDGIDSADAALEAGAGDAWLALKVTAADYADLRAAQIDLARVEDAASVTPGSVGLALLMFGGIERVVPDLARRLTGQVRNAITGEAITALPLLLFELDSPLHLLAVLRDRDLLQPIVARPSEIAERRTALHEASELVGAQPDRTRSTQLGGEHAAVAAMSQRARNSPPAPLGAPMDMGGVIVGQRRQR